MSAILAAPALGELSTERTPQDTWSDARFMAWHNRTPDQINIQAWDSSVQPFQKSFISYTNDWRLGDNRNVFCDSFTESPCDRPGQLGARNEFGKPRLFAQVMPKACATENDNFCIESISEISGNDAQALSLEKEVNPPSWSFTGKQTTAQVGGDIKNWIPSGGSEATLWINPKTKDEVLTSGNLYFTVVAGEVRPEQFSLELFDVQTKFADDFQVDPDRSVTNLPVRRSWNGYRCVYTFTGSCLINVVHQASTDYEVKIRTPKPLSGWFSGRMTSPGISMVKTDHYAVYTINGKPARVPIAWGNVPKTRCPDITCPDNAYFFSKLADFAPWPKNFAGSPLPAGSKVDAWQLFVALTENKATSISTDWSLSLVNGWGSTGCTAGLDDVAGFFTSDAMVFAGTPPNFTNGHFEYQAAGLHFQPDGVTPIRGSFDLLINSKVARCLYGYSNAPISASVSVTSDEGIENVATTNFTERDGWAHVTASGFTFSAPKIEIKLNQAKPAASAPPSQTTSGSASPSASPRASSSPSTAPPSAAKPVSPVRAITLICTKGKLVKKITAIKPKCPSGYTRK